MQTFDFNTINTEGQANDAALRRQQGSSLTWGDPTQKSPGASVPDSTSFTSARPYLPLIQKWFNPGDVGKTVWTGFFESGFDTTKKATDPGSDGATGIFRIQNLEGRPSPDALTDPELNTKYASYLAYRGAAQGIPFDQWTGPRPDQKARYTDWGDEGATYHNPVTGKDEPFGALQADAHPYPGDANVNLPPHPLPDDYHDKLAETQVIIPMLNQSQFDQSAAIKAFQDDPNNYTTQKRQFEIGSEGEFNARRSGMSDKQIFDIETAPASQRIPTPEAQAKLAAMQKQLTDTVSETQRQVNFQVGLNILPALINNPATGNIKDYDSLYSYLDKNKQNFNVFGDQKGNPLDSLSQDQKDYLGKTISTLAPYLNKPGAKPLDQNQMTQFLAAVTTVPDSKRISIASLSSDSIKALLTTRPGGNLTLPQGLTEDALRKYYASDQFASPEAQKSIADLQGQAKNLIDSWVRQDNQYTAIKTGLLDPMSLPILQTKAQGIGAWATGLLSVYSKNVTRPLATLGLIGLSDVNNLFKSLVPDITIPGTNIDLRSIPGVNPISIFGPMGRAINYADTIAGPLLDRIGISAPTSDLQSKFNQNRSNGQNIWEAAGNGFDQWQANGLIKMVAETAFDPLTYLGFGMYSGVTEGIPILGPTVAAIEDGAKIAFENPIVARTALSIAGAGIGYSVTGDWKWALAGAAAGQIPSLRAVPLFTESQLVRNAIGGEGGVAATLEKAFSVFNHTPSAEGLSVEQLQATLDEGLRQVSIDPALAHLTEEGRAARAMLHYTSPEITPEEIGGWVSATRDEAAVGGRMFTAPEVNLETLKDVNYNYDLLLGAKTGILNPAEAADNIARILGLPPEAGPIIADKLSARIDAGIEGVKSLTLGTNANSIAENLVEAARTGYLKQIRSPLYQQGRFQGYVLGLENSLKPVTKTALWKFMAGVQTAITHSQLAYLSFGLQHILELPFRSFVAGAGLNLEINADREGEALLFHGWQNSLPYSIRNHIANSLDLVAGVGKEAPIADSVLAKDRNAFQTLKDWVLLPSGLKERIYANTKAAAYNHFVVDEVTRAAPRDFLSMKNSIDSITSELRDAKFQPEDIESLRKTLVNFSFRPDAPELLRRMAGDIPSLERRATLNEAQSIMDKYTNVDSPYKSYLMKGLQRGEWNPEQIAQNIEDVKNSMLEHEVAKSANYAQALKEYSQAFINTINGNDSALLSKIEGVDLTNAPSVVEAPTEGYHGSGSVLPGFTEGSSDPVSLYGPGVYITNDPAVSKGYADASALRKNQLRAREIRTYTYKGEVSQQQQARIDRDYPAGTSTVHRVQIAPGQKLLNLEQPMPVELADKIEVAGNSLSDLGEKDAWAAAAKAIRDDLPGKNVYGAFKDGMGEFTSSIDAGEELQAFNDLLKDNGYDGLTHIGGGRFNRADLNRHNVTILFDEKTATPAVAGIHIPSAIGELNKAREAVADATSDILSSATERSHSIQGEENISKHWERSNKALSDYVESTTDNLAQMTDAVRQHLGEVNPDVADVASKALDSLQQRIDLINSTRAKSDAVITDWMAAHNGERPRTSAVWDNLIAQRKLIWDNHWTQESRLLKQYQQLTGTPIYDAPQAATNGLTVQHLANFYHSSGDELAQSMVHLQSIMRKEQFVATVGGDVQGAALRARTTQDALGWSDKAIGDLYDQIRVRMNTNPADSPTLLVSKAELDNMRQDLLQLQINKGYSPAQASTVEEAFNKHANFMEANPFDQQDITKAYEQAHLRHSQAFIDYTHENVFDAAIKAVYPFWVHQATRWPWLAGTVLSHPGVGTFLGRYQDYTDKGYVHFPGQDMAFNLLRGNSLMGGFGGLVASSPASYEDGAKGMLGQAYDSMGKAGFFPGFWATLPLNLTGHVGFQLPAPLDTAINATGWAGYETGIDTHILKIRDYLLPSKFRDYYTTEIVAGLSQERNLGYSGEKVRRDIEAGNADDTEKALWTEAQAKMAGYQTLFDQVGVFKLDPEAKRAANREAAQFIYEKTGVTPDQQDAMSTKLGASGLRLSDVLPLDPASTKQLYEMSKFKYWAGLSNVLQPSELQKTQDKISDFWDQVNTKEDIGKTVGFTTSNGTKFESLDSLDQQFRSGQITAKDWNQKQAATRQQISAEIEGLKKSNQFKDTPISLEDRQAWAQKNGTSVPVEHPAKELLNMYYSITPKTDPTTGTPNWDDYFASIDGLLNALPTDRKSYLLDYIQKNWTPTQKLYWQSNSTYLRPYNNLREGILDALDTAQSSFIRAHQGVSPADIDNLPPNEQKLMKDYSSALSNAETRYRELSPQTDAWLYYWGKSGTLETEAARADYNSLTQRYGGPKPLEVPIDESKKRNLLPSLP